MLNLLHSSDTARIYGWDAPGKVVRLIATTAQTRAICNDPGVAGLEYTDALRDACAEILRIGNFGLSEDATVVVNILRGGLNFGLRSALGQAFGWNRQTTCFISAQRARDTGNSEEWHITENAYRKIYFPPETSLVIGDVVATGTSLRYALAELIGEAKAAHTKLKNIVFFTYGGFKAAEILEEMDARCRELFPGFGTIFLVYLEGCFAVPDTTCPLSIRLTGTDLLRRDSVMAPEFIESQYEAPAYPLERCVIYDAGSRAFWVREYADDVFDYWKQVLDLADRGMTFQNYLAERFPELDATRFSECSLREIAIRQMELMKTFLP